MKRRISEAMEDWRAVVMGDLVIARQLIRTMMSDVNVRISKVLQSRSWKGALVMRIHYSINAISKRSFNLERSQFLPHSQGLDI